MPVQLEQVVPFGRSLDEYIQMFNLTAADLQKSILGVGDGPASFNAEGTARGYQICSIDPLYAFSAAQIKTRFDAVVDDIIQQVRNSSQDWVWSYHRSPDALKQSRQHTADLFCADYQAHQADQGSRYQLGSLPHLPFADRTFDLCLCSHLLFLYSGILDSAFHLASLHEMLRVGEEVRVFPLLMLDLQPSPDVALVIQELEAKGFSCAIETVPYEFQRGGNQMLRICRS